MKRGDATVLSVSVVLAVIAVAAVLTGLSLDRRPRPQAVASNASLLVLTWGPSLCKVEPSNSGCRSGHVGRMGRSFVLHGLWPQPSTEQYCDVPKRTADRARKPVALPDDVKTSLQEMMSDSSVMTTHEWYAHGTCSGVTPPEYFGIATALAAQAGEVLDPLFAGAEGRSMSSRAVRSAFDTRFGRGTGNRVGLNCRDSGGSDGIVYEVRLSLPPVAAIGDTPSLASALAAGPAVGPGCGQGGVP